MIEDGGGPTGRTSVFEELLRGALAQLSGRRVWIVDHEPHGRSAGPEAPDVDGPQIAGFRRLLDDGAGHLAAARAAAREQSRQAAVQARALAGFARCRPAAVLDRPEAEVGAAAAASRAARPTVLTEVSEWAVDEVMAALGLPSRTAGHLLADSLTLVEQLPATLAALEAGVIGWPQARMLADVLGPLGDEHRAGVEADVLAGAAGKTVSALRATAQRAVLRADAAAAVRRAATAIRERQVRLFSGEDGMATLSTVLAGPLAAACYTALEAYAQNCAVPGDERTKDQRMVDCLVDLILRPGINGPIQVQLQVVATAGTLTGGQEPGEVNGEPVPALMVRALAYALNLLPRPQPVHPTPAAAPAADHSADQATDRPEAASPNQPAVPDPATDPPEPASPNQPAAPEADEPADQPPPGTGDGAAPAEEAAGAVSRSADEQAAADLAALLGIRATAGTALVERPTIAVIDEISGQLLALTHAGEIRRAATCNRTSCRAGREPCTHPPCGPGLGPPGPSLGYVPADRLDAFVRARDRRCRFPGCRARAERCDLDHNTPWPHGTTSADNLCCLCRHHHRLSHQAPGWTMRRLHDGGLQWTLPGGQQVTTYPPRHGTDDPPPAPPQPEPPPAPPRYGTDNPPPPDTAGTPMPNADTSRPLTTTERILGRRLPPGGIDDGPAPF